MPDQPIRLQASGLAKRFESRDQPVQALDGLDLEVADGEFVSVIGPSGCAKSTLFNLLAGLEEPTAARSDWMGSAATPAACSGGSTTCPSGTS